MLQTTGDIYLNLKRQQLQGPRSCIVAGMKADNKNILKVDELSLTATIMVPKTNKRAYSNSNNNKIIYLVYSYIHTYKHTYVYKKKRIIHWIYMVNILTHIHPLPPLSPCPCLYAFISDVNAAEILLLLLLVFKDSVLLVSRSSLYF